MDESLLLLKQCLRRRRILVVEDEGPIAVVAEGNLLDLGCRVFLAQDIRRAQKIAVTKCLDCALLDIGIGDDTVFAVADILAGKRVPVVFSSGYQRDALPARYQTHVILSKPYQFSDAVRALISAMNPPTMVANPTGDSDADQADGLRQCSDPGPTVRPAC